MYSGDVKPGMDLGIDPSMDYGRRHAVYMQAAENQYLCREGRS